MVYAIAFVSPGYATWNRYSLGIVRHSCTTNGIFHTQMAVTRSPSVPFLERPKKLDGTAPGDVG